MRPSQPSLSDADRQVARDFATVVKEVQPRLRQAFVARYGIDVGLDATAAALGWAWEHRCETLTLSNPVGYLFRVGQSSTRSHFAWTRRRSAGFPPEQSSRDVTSSVDLADAVARLGTNQRLCVLLIHAHGWSYREVADLLAISVDAVTNHVHRGLKRLRQLLEDE